MESEPITNSNSTGKGDEVAICIKDAPPSSNNNIPQFDDNLLVWNFLFDMGMVCLWLLEIVVLGLQCGEQSPFITHGVPMIISIVAIITAILTSAILFYAQKYLQKSSLLRKTHFAILELFSCYSMFLANISLIFVRILPEARIWIGYLVICVTSAIALIACYFIGFFFPNIFVLNSEECRLIRYLMVRNRYLVFIILIPFMLELLVPDNLDLVKFWAIFATPLVALAYNIIFFCKHVVNEEQARDLEANLAINKAKTKIIL